MEWLDVPEITVSKCFYIKILRISPLFFDFHEGNLEIVLTLFLITIIINKLFSVIIQIINVF